MPASLHPLLAASDGPDLQQIIYVIVFLVLAFSQWVYKMWQEKREQAERNRKPPPTAEELEARRRAWQKQAAEQQKAPPSLPAAPPQQEQRPGGLGDLIDTFRKAMEEQTQQQPPPVPQSAPAPVTPSYEQRPRPVVPPVSVPPPLTAASKASPVLQSREIKLEEHAYDLPERPVFVHASAPVLTARQDADSWNKEEARVHSLTAYLRNTGGYRKAFILKEVLDAPKALQKSPWPVD